jgi:hypothetical protein
MIPDDTAMIREPRVSLRYTCRQNPCSALSSSPPLPSRWGWPNSPPLRGSPPTLSAAWKSATSPAPSLHGHRNSRYPRANIRGAAALIWKTPVGREGASPAYRIVANWPPMVTACEFSGVECGPRKAGLMALFDSSLAARSAAGRAGAGQRLQQVLSLGRTQSRAGIPSGTGRERSVRSDGDVVKSVRALGQSVQGRL